MQTSVGRRVSSAPSVRRATHLSCIYARIVGKPHHVLKKFFSGGGEHSKNYNHGQLMRNETENVTNLLVAWSGGDAVALEQLMAIVYQELRRVANYQLAHERPNHTLDSAALVNEAYLRIIDQRHVSWQNRAHFFAIAARLMRRILVDYARARVVAKRGGNAV